MFLWVKHLTLSINDVIAYPSTFKEYLQFFHKFVKTSLVFAPKWFPTFVVKIAFNSCISTVPSGERSWQNNLRLRCCGGNEMRIYLGLDRDPEVKICGDLSNNSSLQLC